MICTSTGRTSTTFPPRTGTSPWSFQNYALYPHMTAYQNISFGLTLQHVKEPVYEDRREVKEALLAIAAAEKEIAALSKGNAAREKQLDALDERTCSMPIRCKS